MWILGFLLLFIAVLILSTRKAEHHYTEHVSPQSSSATLPIFIRAGVPYAILPDGSPAKLSFAHAGLAKRGAMAQGLQDLFMGGNMPVKMPVRLVRSGEQPTLGVLKHSDKSIRTVVVDMGTRQLHFRSDKVLQPGEGAQYTLTPSGEVTLAGESNRLGNISLNLDDINSIGYAGHVSLGGSTMRLRRTVPGQHTSIGSQDMYEGKRRFIFDVVEERVLVQ